MRTREVSGLLLVVLLACPVLAQEQDEDDLSEQERRYYERYVEREEQADAGQPADADDAAAAFRALAEELIRDKNYRVSETPLYRVCTDDPRLDTRSTAALLGGFWSFFESFWSDRLPLADYDGPVDVFLFYSFYKYNKLLDADFTYSTTRPKGHYVAALDVISLHTDADMPGGLADTLIHEAAHQMVEQRIYGHGVPPPLWVAEGLASYFGYTYRDKDGRFHAGEVGGKNAALLRGEKAKGGEAASGLTRFKNAYRSAGFETGDLVEFVVSAQDADAFYFQNPELSYGASWLLVHYLLHGDEGRHAAAFAAFLRKDAAGQGGPGGIYDTVGMSAVELETAILAHLKRVKPR